MPLFLEHPANTKIKLGDTAAIAFQYVSPGCVRWTFDTAVPVRCQEVTYQPPPAGQLIVLDVPEGYKVRVGSSCVWMTYDRANSKFKVTVEGGSTNMRAVRTDERMEPVIRVPTGAVPSLKGNKKLSMVGMNGGGAGGAQ